MANDPDHAVAARSVAQPQQDASGVPSGQATERAPFRWGVPLLLLILAVVGTYWYRLTPGDDLASSYFGCRLVVTRQTDHLYDHSLTHFDRVDTEAWRNIARDSGFGGRPHPYVQTPLWAYALQPLCTALNFPKFNAIFVAANLFSLAGIIWLVARYWTPRLFRPLWILGLALGLAVSEPFQYALYLNQTQALVFLLTLLAVAWAYKGRELGAGAFLAVAAALKVTPGFLLLYWLVGRKWKAALSFLGSSALILALTWIVAGPDLFDTYRHTLDRISNTLLLPFNNQSLSAWWMSRFYSAEEVGAWRIHPLPPPVKAVSLALVMLCQVLGGVVDHRAARRDAVAAPIGAVFALVGATIFSPLAWTHYFVLLIVPAMLLLDANLLFGGIQWPALAGLVLALNVFPLAVDPIEETAWPVTLIRSHFYAGLVCLVGLGLLALSRKGRAGQLERRS